MSVDSLLLELSQLGVRVSAEQGRLRLRARAGVVTDELKLRIERHKPELLALFGAPADAVSPVPRAPADAEIPLASGQRRLWFLEQLLPDSRVYNVGFGLRIRGPLDRDLLRRSLHALFARHDVLRASYPTREGRPRLAIAATPEVALGERVCDGGTAEEFDRALRLALHDEVSRPFDLEHGPLTRLSLVAHPGVGDDHALLVTQHHSITDAWSTGVLVRDLLALYRAGDPQRAELPPLPFGFADYAWWESRGKAERAAALAWWSERLAGLAPLLLATDRPRTQQRLARGETLAFRLPAALAEKLRALSGSRDTTLYVTLLAAYALLLHRYTHERDLGIGTVHANRDTLPNQDVVGFFANTLVLRLNIAEGTSFLALLEHAKRVVADAFAHSAVPFEEVVDAVGLPRDASSQNPLFRTCFSLENRRRSRMDVALGDGRTRWDVFSHSISGSPEDVAKFELSLVLVDDESGLYGQLEFNADLFDRATIERLEQHYERLLDAIVADPARPVSELPMSSAAELRQLAEWGSHAVELERDGTLHERVAAHARRTPDAVACSYGGQSLSYRELDERANRLAHLLRARGVERGAFVAVCLEASLELVVCVLATLKCGAAYVPLDPAYPTERLGDMLSDSEAALVLTHAAARGRLPADYACLVVDELAAELARQPATPPSSDVGPGDAAYMIYTSGSTGRPKGVVVEHRSLVNLVEGQRQRLGVGPGSRMLQMARFGFDAAVWELATALAAGATLCLAPAAARYPGPDLLALLRDEGITIVLLAPSALAALPCAPIPSLRTLVVGGEACAADLVARWLPHTRVVNAYGPTECTVIATLGDCRDDGRQPPIGRPIANVEVRVLDDDGAPTPIGIVGELYIGGAGVARGYWKRDALTAERFVTLRDDDGSPRRFYRSGDLVRWLPDGQLEYVGRRDDQIKIRGYRVELGEIEAALRAHAGVVDAAVVQRTDGPGGRWLVGFVQLREGVALDEAELRAALGRRLPEYMVPARLVAVATLPRTDNGKIDRARLARQPLPAVGGDTAAEPRNPVERALAESWSEVLGRPSVGLHDNFFALGGDSILAIQVLSRARRRGVRISVEQLFRHQTVAELATVARLDEAAAATADEGPVRGLAELTPIQRWFFAQRRQAPHHFNQALLLRCDEPIDVGALAVALEALVAHHDALRLRFERDGETVRQSHAEGVRVPVDVVDLSATPDDALAAAIEARCAVAQASLQLDAAPLMRVTWLDLGPGRGGRLHWVIHHLVVDAVSWRILVEELELAYRAARAGRAPALLDKTTSFQRWAQQLHAYAAREAVAAELPFWEAQSLAAAPLLPRTGTGPNSAASARTVEIRLPADETAGLLHRLPEVFRTQINDVLLTALAEAIGDVAAPAGATAVRIDVEGHGREELDPALDVSRTVGWFTTLYPLRLSLPEGDAALRLGAVKEQLRRVPRHGIGYGLLRYLRAVPSLEAPPAEISFNYLGQLDGLGAGAALFRLAPESAGPMHAPGDARTHALEISGAIFDGELRLGFTYSPNLHAPATVERLADRFVARLRALLAEAERPGAGRCTPSDFPLARLDQDQLDRLIGAGRDVEDVYPLSPMQQGMLFHALRDGGGVYVEQLTMRVEEELDAAAFVGAWEAVIARHPALRTAFAWEGLDEPRQIVHRSAPLVWSEEDLRAAPPAEQQRRIDEYLARDREHGFDLARAPLLRLALFRLGGRCWQVVVTYHHLILDGWSLALVHADLLTRYGGRPLPARARPYRDFIAWLAGRDSAAAEAYWREQLQGFSVPTPLTLRRPRRSAGGRGEVDLRLSPVATAALTEAARSNEVTLGTLLQAAWGLLLSRYAGEADVMFGLVVSGRSAGFDGVADVVGPLLNTVPVRVRVANDCTVRQLWRDLARAQAERTPYEEVPLATLQQWSDVPRGQPLMESALVLENYPMDAAWRAGRLPLSISEVRAIEQSSFPLALLAAPGEVLTLRALYDAARFDGAAVARMVEHFRRLVDAMAARPTATLGELALVDDPERRLTTVTWNETARPYPVACVHTFVEAQAARTPEATALVCREQQLSYAALDGHANQLARHLAARGVGPGALVAICLERSADLWVAVLGVLKAGAAFVPIDAGFPRDRIALMIEDSDPALVLTSAETRALLPADARVVTLAAAFADAAAGSTAPLACIATPDDLAYVTYTSGSTGRPKGVAMPHRPLCNLLSWQCRSWSVPGPARTLQFASISFDISFEEAFSTWMSGGTLVMASEEARHDPEALLELIADAAVERAHLPPVVLHLLVKAAERRGRAPQALREIMAGGELLVVDEALRAFLRDAGGCALTNHYGPTEAHVVAWLPLGSEPPLGEASIGRPIDNLRFYILDRALQPVPLGVPGQLYIGGAGLARGYWKRPELTAERFIASPLPEESGPLYETGDLVRWNDDGSVEFIGRVDHQVKIRGVRIELGEVEAVLGAHPAVRQCAVVARDAAQGKRLVAYVALREATDAAALRRHLEERLLEAMVPSAFVVLDELPLSNNGKIDRNALPADARDAIKLAPRGEVECALAALWQEILGVAAVGADDDFFELGGHSLLVTQVVARIQTTWGVKLPLRSLFEKRTLAELAAAVEDARAAATTDGDVAAQGAIPRAPREGRLPLSCAQQRLWFFHQLDPASPFYNVPIALRVRGPLDVEALRRALDAIVARHETLRTVFAAADGEPYAVVRDAVAVDLPIAPLDGMPRDAADAELARRIAAEVHQPFDLAAGPLVRVQLFRLAADEHVLLITAHHIVIDGWSVGVLTRELSIAYVAARRHQAPPWPPLPLQYPDFAVWQQSWLQRDDMRAQLDWWVRQLTGAPPLQLPVDRPRPPVQRFRGDTRRFVLDPELARALEQLARRENATLFMVLLAAFQVLLGRYAGQEDVVVGSPIAGRGRAELEPLIGFFVNTLVLRGDLSGDPTFTELLARVRRTTLDAYEHQTVPFEKVVEAIQPERDLSRMPLFQVMLVLQNAPLEALRLGDGSRIEYVDVESRTSKMDLTLVFWDADGALRGALEYDTDLFDAATVERMVASLRVLLGAIAAAPQTRIGALPLVSADERAQLVAASRGPARPRPDRACIHELVTAQARRTPDAVAVASDGVELSYAALEARANRLAHRLRALGVDAERPVGICLDRSVDLLVAILAVLKAGGSFVPLDPDYPPERLVATLADSGAAVLLAEDTVAARFDAFAGPLLLRSQWRVRDDIDPGPPTGEGDDGARAYVIYTSGSTGVPKGVETTHAAFVNLIRAMQETPGIAPGDVMVSVASIAFDMSLPDLFLPLSVGGRVVIATRGEVKDPLRLAALLQTSGATLMAATPTHWRMLLDSGWRGRPGFRVLCGGEPFSRQLVDEVLDRGMCFWNIYGPTEAAVYTTFCRLDRGSGPISLGAPIPNTAVYVLDGHRQPLPVGAIGELYIGGEGLGRGYLGRPELTTERFVPDPFAATAGARMYRTGDLVRRHADGTLEFIGRADQQVKLRGFRIELGEIEVTLERHAGVRECAVVVREHPTRGKELIAYFVPRIAGQVSAGELDAYLRERLPAHMVPAVYVELGALPRTANDKIHRGALPAPSDADRAAQQDYVPPRDPVEADVAAAFAEVLALPRVGLHDNFFAAGGTSLSAVRLVARLKKAAARTLSLTELFQHPTVAGVAALVRGAEAPWSPLVCLQPAGSATPFFCVPPVGGLPVCYAALARQLGDGRPFYSFQARGTAPGQRHHDSVETMAAEYVSALRTVQPHGPYLLGGWSMGGVVAVEMGQQLLRAGETVALVALLDTASELDAEQASDDEYLAGLARIFGLAVDGASPAERRARFVAAVRAAGVLPADFDDDELERLLTRMRAHRAAAERYAVGDVPFALALFAATDRTLLVDGATFPRAWRAVDLGWHRHARAAFRVEAVPGSHETMVQEPNVQRLAASLGAALAAADQRLRDPTGQI